MIHEQDTKERPIIFSGEMVRAILEGRKTQTRQVIKPQPGTLVEDVYHRPDGLWIWLHLPRGQGVGLGDPFCCPYGKPGDRLWVRETFLANGDLSEPAFPTRHTGDIMYADDEDYDICYPEKGQSKKGINWRVVPSIYMPRWASRINLEVTNVRVERVQDITIDDIKAEIGERALAAKLPAFPPPPPRGVSKEKHLDNIIELVGKSLFRRLWDSINAKRGHPWENNDWVWVVEFSVSSSVDKLQTEQ